MTRADMLILDVAQQFEDMAQPMNGEWLENRNVSIVELSATAVACGMVLRSFIAMSERRRSEFIALGMVATYGSTQSTKP